MSLHEMQTILDENKQDMREGAYLSLCNNLKRLHEYSDELYVVTYFEYPNVEPGTSVFGYTGDRTRIPRHVLCLGP